MKNYQKKKNNKNNSIELCDAINRIGITPTKELILNFLNNGEMTLGGDEGLVLAIFMGYYDISPQINNEAIISQFINFAFYKKDKINAEHVTNLS
jgi:hypothetical protein